METLDVILLLALVGFAISGYRQGMVVGVLSFLGFLSGGLFGIVLAPSIATSFSDLRTQAIVAVAVVFVAATVGQLLATVLGSALRSRISWHHVRVLDSIGGAVVSVVSVLVVAWLVATSVAQASALSGLARQVRQSVVLQQVDQVMPDSARTWFSAFRRLLDQNGFPQVFGALGPPEARPVAPPDPRVLSNAAVRRAAPAVVKIVGTARECRRSLEGSGFLYAPERVMTNAHVVAGIRSPRVLAPGRSDALDATVVVFDPKRDVAVLYVPGLAVRPLAWAGEARPGDPAVVVGYPEGGPFTALPARVRGVQNARGPDIYQGSQVTREIYAIRAMVRPGNSGGPLLAADGRVYGVVFAAALDDRETGYALTRDTVAADAEAGRTRTAAVSTNGCD